MKSSLGRILLFTSVFLFLGHWLSLHALRLNLMQHFLTWAGFVFDCCPELYFAMTNLNLIYQEH